MTYAKNYDRKPHLNNNGLTKKIIAKTRRLFFKVRLIQYGMLQVCCFEVYLNAVKIFHHIICTKVGTIIIVFIIDFIF